MKIRHQFDYKPGVREALVALPGDVKDKTMLSALMGREIAINVIEVQRQSMERIVAATVAMLAASKDGDDVEFIPTEEGVSALKDAVAESLSTLMALKDVHGEFLKASADCTATLHAIATSIRGAKGEKGEEPADDAIPDEAIKAAFDLIRKAAEGRA